MTGTITVLIRAAEEGAWLNRLVTSLDAQDLPYDRFDVAFLVSEPSGLRSRLTELSGRRPNVRVVQQVSEALDHGSEWFLDIGSNLAAKNPYLYPQALSGLVEFGTRHACQAVLGRVVIAAAGAIDARLLGDNPRLEPDQIQAAAAGAVAAVRRELVSTDDGSWASDRAETVGVRGEQPFLLVRKSAGAPTDSSIRVETSSAEWDKGMLVVRAAGSGHDLTADTVLFGLHQLGGIEYVLPTTTTECASGRFSGSSAIDLTSAALDHGPLTPGVWKIVVGTHAGPSSRFTYAAVPSPTVGPGLVEGTLVAIAAGRDLAIDIGATRQGIVPPVTPPDVTIAESSAGTLMTVSLPGLHAYGDSRTSGHVHLDGFGLPAHLIVDSTVPRVECFVSGLAGTSSISTRFGAADPHPTGLDLTISPVGTMTVARRPKPTPPAARTSPAASEAPTSARNASPVRALRHNVPPMLEPAVERLARNRAAARVYRALGNIGSKSR
jgi:hypothetical protein